MRKLNLESKDVYSLLNFYIALIFISMTVFKPSAVSTFSIVLIVLTLDFIVSLKLYPFVKNRIKPFVKQNKTC